MQTALKRRVVPRERVFFDWRRSMPDVASMETKKEASYADCLLWPEDFRAEIFDGEVLEMPAPSAKHQRISLRLTLKIGNFLGENPIGELFVAPFDVRLFPRPDNSDDLVLEPDLIVVKDRAKIDERCCNGAPDLVIEILSPSRVKYDRVRKRDKYEEAGVTEYWVLDPKHDTVTVHLLRDGHYEVAEYGAVDALPVAVLPGCVVDLGPVFGV